jgi:DMSO/TMAO reductase YedYZ molybdopterin-dependent catalytic subunit
MSLPLVRRLLKDCLPTSPNVWSQGADGGDYHGVPIPAYVKDLPLVEAQRAEVLLATHMNGDLLNDKHGGPVRLVVPGYYGTNSTKWLVRLELQATRSPGYFTTSMYNDVVVKGGKEERMPVWRTAPHSVLVNPVEGAVLKCGRTLTIAGWAWGADPIVDVEVSTDAGVTWSKAPVSKRQDMSWQRFELDWTPQSPGPCRMLCRAVDSVGVPQPVSGTRNAVLSIDVSVE